MLDTIFVSVASYRDLECHNTVADLFRQVGLTANVAQPYQPAQGVLCLFKLHLLVVTCCMALGLHAGCFNSMLVCRLF